ncbi:DMT family transporter [Flavimaricola marinus]
MITAMAFFAIEDSLLKSAATSVPVGQIMVLFGLGGAAVFAAVARWNGEALYTPDVISPAMRVRFVFELVGRLFYTLAITLIPLSAATVILQATPLVVVAGAALVFGETVGWRRWVAIVIGLIGVIIIVQPGTDSFSALSIIAVLGMLGFAGRDLASRAAPASLSTALLGVYGFLTIVLAGAIYGLWQGAAFVMPSGTAGLLLIGAILSGAFAYGCLMRAMRTGEVSAVTPYRYTRLLFGIGLGVLLFGEEVSGTMILGSGLIVFSGLFIRWRGRQAQKG